MTNPAFIQPVTNAQFYAAVFHTVPDGAQPWGASFKTPPERASGGDWAGGPLTQKYLAANQRYTDGAHNTFYAISSFYSGSNGRVRRQKNNFAACHVIVLDDIGDGASAKIPLDKIMVAPSFVIETSPGNYHVGYILSEPATDADLIQRTQDALVAQKLASDGKDPGMKGVTRYMRFPVGVNNKEKYDPPHQHVLKDWHPERRYTMQEIIDGYGLELADPNPDYVRPWASIALEDDPYPAVLSELGLVLTGEVRDGNMLDILCPNHKEHSDRVDGGCVYFIGDAGIHCFHGHCVGLNSQDLKGKLRAEYGVDTEALDQVLRDLRRADEATELRIISEQIGPPSAPWTPEKPEPGAVDGMPECLLNPPGLAGEIADYHNRRSHRKAPINGVTAGLACMSALARGRYALEMPRRPAPMNLYLLATGGTGSGKEDIRTTVKGVLKVADLDLTTTAASDVGLLKRLAKRQAAVLMADEFGRLLRFAGSASGGSQYALLSECMKLYGLALSSTEERAYADSKNNIPPIERPYLALLATATPNSVTDAMTSEEVVGGTLNRFVVIPNHDNAAPFQDCEAPPMSEQMKNRVREFSENLELGRRLGGRNEGGYNPLNAKEYIPITPTEAAVAVLLEYREEADARRRDANAQEGHLWARSYENALRVAACIAIGDSAVDKPVLSAENAQWAVRFMRWSTGQAIGLLAHIADSEIERDSQRIVAFAKEIVAHPPKGKHFDLNSDGWVAKTQFAREFRGIESNRRKALLVDLVEGDFLEFKEFPSAGNSKAKINAYRPLRDE